MTTPQHAIDAAKEINAALNHLLIAHETLVCKECDERVTTEGLFRFKDKYERAKDAKTEGQPYYAKAHNSLQP